MLAPLSALVLLSAVLAIRTDQRAPTLYYVFKPLTMILILAVTWLAPADASSPYHRLILVGLLFSLAGDVFLMLPPRAFVAGLSSFLVAHLFYLGAFATTAPLALAPLALLPFLVGAGAVLRTLWPHLHAMKLPVAVYVLVIVAMGWRALAQWLALGTGAALLACAGAVLFVVSDAVLALERFRGGVWNAQAVVLGSYYAAQWSIALSTHGMGV